MAKTDFKNIDQYHLTFSGETLNRLNQIRELIHEIAPNSTEVISYQIPAFKVADKVYLIYYCAFEKHISISNPWSKAFLEHFEYELKNYKISKAIIQFPHNKPLPLVFLKEVLQFRLKECLQKLPKKS